MRKKKYILVALAVCVGLSLAVTLAGAAQNLAPINLSANDTVTITCKGGKLQTTGANTANAVLKCLVGATPTPTPASTATPTPAPTVAPPPSSDKGICGELINEWHPPVITGSDGKSCATGHDHGDAPPDWIKAAGYNSQFIGLFNTSAQENVAKHSAMKGFSTNFNGVEVYFRVHAASNPLDRSARYHSYEVWARDPSGGVSHWQGWYNTGDPIQDRFPRRQGVEINTRPVMLVVDQTSWDQGIRCEQWYANTAIWSWDFGWTICNSTTLYVKGEHLDPANQARWLLAPDATKGGTRRLEAAWYNNTTRPHPTGKFVATQFGDIVSGTTDARCTGTTVKFGVAYPNVCLEQYIAPTMAQVAFPNNAVQKNFDTTGVKIPN